MKNKWTARIAMVTYIIMLVASRFVESGQGRILTYGFLTGLALMILIWGTAWQKVVGAVAIGAALALLFVEVKTGMERRDRMELLREQWMERATNAVKKVR